MIMILFIFLQYNIPVEFFPPLKYPVEAPKIFIRPTASTYFDDLICNSFHNFIYNYVDNLIYNFIYYYYTI